MKQQTWKLDVMRKLNRFYLLAALLLLVTETAFADTITHGKTTIEIELVNVGNPGNAPDTEVMWNDGTTGYGSVDYAYRIGKYEVTSAQWATVFAADPNLGAAEYWGGLKPVGGISWYKAAKFCNWLTSGSVATGVYTFAGSITNPTGVTINRGYRNAAGMAYFIPNEDEWYKAAYYDGVKNVYYDFPTGSDYTLDVINFENDPEYDVVVGWTYEPYEVTNAGAPSPYGTIAQGGNVMEWTETAIGSLFAVRGAAFLSNPGYVASNNRDSFSANQNSAFGFRIASVPEPCSMVLLLCSVAAGLVWWIGKK